MRDLHHNLSGVSSFDPAAQTATVTGTGVDLLDYDSAEVVISVGTITDGTHTPKLQESATSNSGFADVAAADQLGVLAALVSATPQQVGYVGSKRYLRVFVTVAGTTTGGVYGAMIERGNPRRYPAGAAQTP